VFFLEKQFVNVGQIKTERSYVKQTSLPNRRLFYFGTTEMKSASYLRTKKQITEDLVQKIQDAETLTLFSSLQSQESGEACEHGKYSGIIILLRDNPTDKGGVL